MQERRLAAIMFTDIVGYTTLMGSDEDRAFEVLAKNREIHKQLVEKFNGTLIKEIGDGMLISFKLASDAVYCAIEIQKLCKAQDIPLKIGIHEGEMVFEGADVLGDAVNVASRLESGTQQGCISISGSVYRDIKNRKDIQTKFIKEKKFKNVDEPIKVYEVLCGEEVQEQQSKLQDKFENPKGKNPYYLLAGLAVIAILILFLWKLIPSKEVVVLEKSIAVKPFWNESTDQENEHWVNGMTEDIRNNLSKMPELRVISRTTMEKYRDTKMSSSEIGEELNVSYLLEGTVQKLGNQVKINAQLILAGIDDHLWEKTYIEDISDVTIYFKVQSDIAQSIAKGIGMKITPKTKEIIESNPTSDLTAYEYYLKGKDYRNRGFEKNMTQMYEKAENMYQEAVEIDSNFVLAWLGLAQTNREYYFVKSKYRFQMNNFKSSKEDYLKKIQQEINKSKNYLDKAIALKPDLMEVRREEGAYNIHCLRDLPKALQILEKLHVDYPKDDQTILMISAVWKRMGQSEKSLDYLGKAISLNPSGSELFLEAATNLIILRRYDEAEKFLEKANLLNPHSDDFYYRLFYMYCRRRKIKEAKQYLEEHKDIIDENRLRRFNIDLLWAEGNFEKSIREVENILNDSTISINSLAVLHYELGWKYMHLMQKEKQKEHFQKGKEIFENLPDAYKGEVAYSKYAVGLAGLGMITQALDTINKVLEVADIIGKENFFLSDVQLDKTFILVLSGDYDALFDQMNYILSEYGGKISLEQFKCSPSQIKCDPFWSQFSEMERFQEIINNPDYQAIPLEK